MSKKTTSCHRNRYSYSYCRPSNIYSYAYLRSVAQRAIKEKKVFTIHGSNSCIAIRKALIDRGWVEKMTSKQINLINAGKCTSDTYYYDEGRIHGELEQLLMVLSNLVEKHESNFIWHTYNETETKMDVRRDTNTIINKLKFDTFWTTKQGLCSSMKRNYWYHIDDVAEVVVPRTYINNNIEELRGFETDYKITACTSLLKWFLSMVANDRLVFNKDRGTVSINIIGFALNRCKEYLLKKEHKDIDCFMVSVSVKHWYNFLRKYDKVIRNDEAFRPDKNNKLKLYISYAKFFLKQIYKFRPQLSCEGCHNMWILKPDEWSRGRGIRIISNLDTITKFLDQNKNKYVIQKYIEEPLLIYDTKFDIRQYYLITSTYPLVIWMYKNCYLKFSSQKYSLKNFHESIHLTNNAVQRNYKNFFGRHCGLPSNNMWDLEKYQQYLHKRGKSNVWKNIIYPGMKKSVIGAMLSCQDSMKYSKKRFELYGCDFILDKEYKPWLIEINSCPDLKPTTQITEKICPAVLADLIKVVIDHAANPKASTGNFECAYRQSMTVPSYYGADLVVKGCALPFQYFYRGQLSYKEPCNRVSNECIINAAIKKLQETCDIDIMVDPDDDSDTDLKKDQETYTHRTLSEQELIDDAAIITNQIEELINYLPVESTMKCDPDSASLETIRNSSTSESETINGEVDIKSVFKNTLYRASLKHSKSNDRCFSKN